MREMKKSDTFVYFVEGKPYVNLTNRCTNNCNFCIRIDRQGMENSVLWLNHEPTGQEVIAQLPSDVEKYGEVVFCGFGEPTFNLSALVEAGKYLREKGVRVRLNTNGHGNRVNGRDVTPELRQAVDVVSVSLNQCDGKKYDEICRCIWGEEGFDEMLDFAAKAKAQGLKVILSVVDVIGEDSVEKCRKIADGLGIPLRVREFIPEEKA